MSSSTIEPGSTMGPSIFDVDWPERFEWYEYFVFGILLAASMAIGIFYGFFGSKNKTNEEFLMAGRSMPVFPVALSVICSFISAVTILGNPLEIYYYGLQYIMNVFAFVILGLSLSFLYIPVYFKLQLTSIFEYFEMRYDRYIRVTVSISQICHGLIYMPLTVYGPALALEEVAGINTLLTCAIIFIVCVAYSSMGGLKAVLWTDALQAFVMLASMISVMVVGVNEIGGFDEVWRIGKEAGRTEVWNTDTDFRARHTLWTSLIGGYFNWIALFGATQAQIQRYLSVPTLRKAQLVVLIAMTALILIVTMCSFTGLIIYANYYRCDPLSLKAISAGDQLLPLFVMDKLGNIAILPGLFVAGLTAGSLSSVSSTLNSLAAIITEDYVKKFRPNLNEFQLGLGSKIISVVGGLIAFAIIFVIAAIGDVLPFASLLHGAFIGPILGAFSLGMFFPWTNWIGVLMGIVPTFFFTLFIGVGSILSKDDIPDQKLIFHTDLDVCYPGNGDSTPAPLFLTSFNERVPTDWKDKETSGLTDLFSMSYLWQPVIPVLCSTILGLIFSFIVNHVKKEPFRKSKESYFCIPILRIWEKIFGREHLRKYVLFEDEEKIDEEPYTTIPRVSLASQKVQNMYGSITGLSVPEIKVSSVDSDTERTSS